ncbi:ankyrin repeat domain-containing protein [Candidatus Babeliales bacterium]|nr:ankyrin repeat domain-containing protein [Candidatus Babeliales bacterium]
MKQIFRLLFLVVSIFCTFKTRCCNENINCGKSKLYSAANKGEFERLKYLIEEKNIDSKSCPLLLHCVCNSSEGNLDIVKYLIEEQGFDLNFDPPKRCFYWLFGHCCIEYYNAPLFYAFKKGNVDIVKYLLSKLRFPKEFTETESQITKEKIIQFTPKNKIAERIICFCQKEEIEKLDKFLKKQKINLKIFTEQYNDEIMKYIHIRNIKRNSDNFNLDNLEYIYPLEIAFKLRSIDLLKYLIEECKLDFTNTRHENIFYNFFENAYHDDLDYKILDCTKYLIEECKIDPNIKGSNGETLLHYVCQFCCCKKNLEVIDYLIKKGIDPNIQNENGDTPLHIAITYNNMEVMKHLIEKHNVDLNIKSNDGETPILQIQTSEVPLEIVDYLIKKGADPTVQDKYGVNILHCACWYGRLDIVKYLIEICNMDPCVPQKDGRTVLDITKELAYNTNFDRWIHKNKEKFEKFKVECLKIIEYLERL